MNEKHDILAEKENRALDKASDGAEQKGEGLLFSEELDLDSLFDFASLDDFEHSETPSIESEKKEALSKASGNEETAKPGTGKEGAQGKGIVLGPTLHISAEDSADIRSKLKPNKLASKLPSLSAPKSDLKENGNGAGKNLNGLKLGMKASLSEAAADNKPAEAAADNKPAEANDDVMQTDASDVTPERTTESVTLGMEDIKASASSVENSQAPAKKDAEPAKKDVAPVSKAEKSTPHVLSKDSDSIEISAVSDVIDPEKKDSASKKDSDSIEISAISSIVDTKKPEKISSSIEISGVSSTVNAEDKKPWEQTESSVSEICSVPDVEANFEKTQINLDAVGGEKNVTVIKKGHSPQLQPMEPIVFDVEEVAPDMSNEPVQPKSVFEKTMSFEMSDNRWDHADKFELPEIGDVVGNYQVTGLLGKGGFGAVYRAKNLTLGREEALKLILPSAKSECEDIEKRFEREIDIVSRLEHPNIVRLYSSGLLEHHVLWMTMELVKGARLDDRLSQYGPMKFPKAKNLMLQLLSGLMEAHRRQIVHRDLKPANIMLSKKEGYADQVVILDFGLSKALGDTEDESKQNLTCVDSRRVYGTPQYMAPEQLKQGKLGPWTDVYAAGLIFYEILTEQEAVQGMSLFDVAYKQTYEDLEFPPDLQDTAVEAMLKRACAKNPAERYKNAGEFFDALQHIEEISDPPSVLSDSRKNDTNLANMGMLSKTRDEKSEEKTQLGLQAISMDPTEVIRHAEHTGRSRRRADGIKIALFVVSALLVGLIVIGVCAYFFGYLSITV